MGLSRPRLQKVGCTRRQAKAINFGIIYGKGIATLAADLGVDDETAGEYLRGWDEQAPTGAKWRSERPRLYARSAACARRGVGSTISTMTGADVSANTRPMNFPVQGGAADVMHRAMRLLFERYRDWPGNVLPVLTIHDEILVEVDADAAEEVGTLLAGVMVEAFVMSCRTDRRDFWLFPASGRPGRRQRRTVKCGKRRCGRLYRQPQFRRQARGSIIAPAGT